MAERVPIETSRTNEYALRIGVVYWRKEDGLASSVSSILEQLGCKVEGFASHARLPRGLDAVFAHGPFGSLVPLANQLLACEPSQRPSFALWMTEQLSDPDLPEWVRYAVSVARSRVERLAFRQRAPGEWQIEPRLRWLTANLNRFRYYGDLVWLEREGVLSVLAVGSRWIADFLRGRGFAPCTVYLGSHSSWGADLELERDIPVLWIGKVATERRRRLLKRVRAELGERGVEVLMIDGVENPAVFGGERTILLNRTKIVLNILRREWDNHSLRYFLAAPNRALIVTEPTFAHIPFVPGVHYAEAPVEHLADVICHYLSCEQERRQIVERAYRLVTTDLTMKASVSQILDQVARVRQNGNR